MKVLFDISVLGYGALRPALRTGVYRATERLAEALVTAKATDLSFCASDSPSAWALSYDYWKTGKVRDFPFLPRPTFGNCFVPSVNQLTRLNTVQEASLNTRVVRRLLREIAKWTEPKEKALLNISKGSVFHSPFYPLKRISEKASRVLSIYDIIRLTHPETNNGNGDFLKEIVASLEKDDWTVCSSEWTRDELLNYRKGLNENRVVVIPLGVDDSFAPSSDHEISEVRKKYQIGNNPYFLGVSTSEKRKNFPFLIRAFQQFIKKRPESDVKLILVGAFGETVIEIKNIISSGFEDRVVLTGFVPDSSLAPLYSGALAFTYPSLYEGFGLPPLEAMACGCPVLAGLGSSLTEVVGAGGQLIDPRSEEAWVDAMEKLYDSPSEIEAWRNKGLAWVKNFTWQKCASEHSKLYRLASQA